MNFHHKSIILNKDPKDCKVVVAMSGGVDSSVVAVMLKKFGYQVIGITLQLYDHGESLKKKNACCAGTDIYDAKKVAEKHDFPHYVLNYQNNFKESVIDDFVDTYLQGQTPIPCVKCNQTVKFRDLMQVAFDLNADCMATGHYVQRKFINNSAQLHKAIDNSKDQSYFLFTTTQAQLDFLRFPLGEFTKEQTRKLAEEFGLEIANKPDSQDICFVPSGDYAQVIKKYRPESLKIGEIIHINTGKVLGQHNGIINFTIGQRRGLKIAYPNPLYVIKIDPKNNQILVGEENYLDQQIFIIGNCNWLVDQSQLNLQFNQKFAPQIRIRSNNEEQPASIEFLENNKAKITMKSMTRAITKGQAGVVYSNDRVLGGGWIEEVF
jgi:tRNA-specific 2-thiouridylase